MMANESYREIKSIQIGNLVFNPIAQRVQPVKRLVVGKEEPPLITISYGGNVVKVTERHPMVVKHIASPSGYILKQAGSLTPNDEILGEDGLFHKLTVLSRLPADPEQIVVNIELSGSSTEDSEHFLLANGIITGDLFIQEKLERETHSQNQLIGEER